jgi:hypothetical protein
MIAELAIIVMTIKNGAIIPVDIKKTFFSVRKIENFLPGFENKF